MVESGSTLAHRCARCRGIWLDPASFQRVCDAEARSPDDDGALAPATPARAPDRGRRLESRVRYRPCPACGEVMNRSNFGRVSGVVIDVCRAHGAWLDRGELGAIRRFLRGGGLRRYARIRRLEREAPRPRAPAPTGARDASVEDVLDVLAGGGGWDVPRVPRPLLAAAFAALGGWFLWTAFHPRGFGRSLGMEPVLLGSACLYVAWRAIEPWIAGRRR